VSRRSEVSTPRHGLPLISEVRIPPTALIPAAAPVRYAQQIRKEIEGAKLLRLTQAAKEAALRDSDANQADSAAVESSALGEPNYRASTAMPRKSRKPAALSLLRRGVCTFLELGQILTSGLYRGSLFRPGCTTQNASNRSTTTTENQ
jgi:hypothetical protein